MKKYKNLAYIFQNDLSYELEISREEGISFVKNSINDRLVNIDDLRIEVDCALNDKTFDWVSFAYEHKLIWDIDSTSDKNVIELMYYCIWELLYPEKAMEALEINDLVVKALVILKGYESNDGWMLLEDIYKEIRKTGKYHSLQYHYMYYIYPNAISQLERKNERGQGKEILYLKYKDY